MGLDAGGDATSGHYCVAHDMEARDSVKARRPETWSIRFLYVNVSQGAMHHPYMWQGTTCMFGAMGRDPSECTIQVNICLRSLGFI